MGTVTHIYLLKEIHQLIEIRNNRNKKVILKNCVPFTDCLSKTNNMPQVDNAKDIDVVMPTYNLTEYSNNYSKTSSCLWQYTRCK